MDEEKQTTPKGTEIPVPKRKDWERVLERAAKPKDSPKDSAGEK